MTTARGAGGATTTEDNQEQGHVIRARPQSLFRPLTLVEGQEEGEVGVDSTSDGASMVMMMDQEEEEEELGSESPFSYSSSSSPCFEGLDMLTLHRLCSSLCGTPSSAAAAPAVAPAAAEAPLAAVSLQAPLSPLSPLLAPPPLCRPRSSSLFSLMEGQGGEEDAAAAEAAAQAGGTWSRAETEQQHAMAAFSPSPSYCFTASYSCGSPVSSYGSISISSCDQSAAASACESPAFSESSAPSSLLCSTAGLRLQEHAQEEQEEVASLYPCLASPVPLSSGARTALETLNACALPLSVPASLLSPIVASSLLASP